MLLKAQHLVIYLRYYYESFFFYFPISSSNVNNERLHPTAIKKYY